MSSNYEEFVAELKSLGLTVKEDSHLVILPDEVAADVGNGRKLSPCLNIDKVLERGMTPAEIKDTLYSCVIPVGMKDDVNSLFEKPGSLYWELIGGEVPVEVLYKQVFDFKAVPFVKLRDNAVVKVNKGLAEMWGLTEQEVFDLCEVHQDWQVIPMTKYLKENYPAVKDALDCIDFELTIATNKAMTCGAAVLLDDAYLKAFRQMNGDFFILPSSRHEVLFLGVTKAYAINGDETVDKLKDMVRQVNETEVSPVDFLSNSVFMYTEEGLIKL